MRLLFVLIRVGILVVLIIHLLNLEWDKLLDFEGNKKPYTIIFMCIAGYLLISNIAKKEREKRENLKK